VSDETPNADAESRRALVWERLLDWYTREGRSGLPWRHTRDPYAVLVSEVMLQQTQVDRVLPKYRAFLTRFPTLAALAAAPRAEVIQAWAGLGYNSRAVRLHEIARQAVERYGGALPDTLDGLMALKGIGRYTAGAVACFAFGLPVATVDTNIRRTLWRLFRGIEPAVWPADTQSARAALALAEWALPPGRAYDWQQALMDLGATICLARRPLCVRCPVSAGCAAYQETARVTLFPSGEALARLRDERGERDATGPVGRVAEERAEYATHGRRGPGRAARKAEPPFTQSSRYFRGRVVEALRGLPLGDSLALRELGVRLREGYSASDLPWLEGIVQGLARDGLARWIAPVDGGERRVALPE
jgi:A/G-specific adenine glycosylase